MSIIVSLLVIGVIFLFFYISYILIVDLHEAKKKKGGEGR